MYHDKNLVRNNRISINLDQYEDDLIAALAAWSGIEKSALVREMIMQGAMDMLGVTSQQEFDATSLPELEQIARLH